MLANAVNTDLHLINSVGQAGKATAIPAPAPHMICWLIVSGEPGSDLRSAFHLASSCEEYWHLRLQQWQVGHPCPINRPPAPSLAIVCLTASIAPENLGAWPGKWNWLALEC